jgi:hypothetical protein
VGADDARLPSLHEIASRPHPANHAQRNGPTSNPRQPISPRARSTTACAQCCCSLSVCLSLCLSVRTPACPLLCVQPVCAPPLLDPRSSILTTPHFLASRFSLLPASLARSRTARQSGGPPSPKSHSQSLRCWTHHPKVTRPAGPPHQCASSPTISPRESLSDGAGKPRRFSSSLSPSLPSNPSHGHLHHTRHLVVARTHHSYLTTYTRAGDDSHNTQTALHSQR